MNIEIHRIQSDSSHPNSPYLHHTPKNSFLKSALNANTFSFNFAESFEERVFGSFQDRRHQYFRGSTLKMKQVVVFSAGSVIGEKAFLSERGLALTTVITYEDCYLLALDKKDYDLVFADEMLKIKDKISFLEKVFPQTPRSQLAMVSYFFEKIVCRNDQIIYKQEQEAKAVYLVLKGEIQVKLAFWKNT